MTIGGVGEFDGTMWRVGGQYSDPDGEPVTFTIEVEGQEIGQILVSGNTWESEWIIVFFKTSILIYENLSF